MIQKLPRKKLFIRKIVNLSISILILLCIKNFTYHYWQKSILTENFWYVSKITKADSSPLEQFTFLLGEIFEYKKNGEYVIYNLDLPGLLLRNRVYYGTEKYDITADSLIMDDYKRVKLLCISKDSIVFSSNTNYSYLDTNNIAKGNTTMLIYTLKPIYGQKVSADHLRREKRSSKFINID